VVSENKLKEKKTLVKLKPQITFNSPQNPSTACLETLDDYFSKRILKELSRQNQSSAMESMKKNFEFLKRVEGFDKSDVHFNKMMLSHQRKFGMGRIKSEFMFKETTKGFQFVSPTKLLTKEIIVLLSIFIRN